MTVAEVAVLMLAALVGAVTVFEMRARTISQRMGGLLLVLAVVAACAVFLHAGNRRHGGQARAGARFSSRAADVGGMAARVVTV